MNWPLNKPIYYMGLSARAAPLTQVTVGIYIHEHCIALCLEYPVPPDYSSTKYRSWPELSVDLQVMPCFNNRRREDLELGCTLLALREEKKWWLHTKALQSCTGTIGIQNFRSLQSTTRQMKGCDNFWILRSHMLTYFWRFKLPAPLAC